MISFIVQLQPGWRILRDGFSHSGAQIQKNHVQRTWSGAGSFNDGYESSRSLSSELEHLPMMVGGSVLIQDEEGATSVDDGRASAGWVAPVMINDL